MNVHDSGGGIDSAKFLEYIINQFPGDLRMMVEVRDELVVRQGAVSAAQLAIADRAVAAKELEDARLASLELLTDAKADNAKAKAKKAALDDRESSINSREKMISDELTLRDSDVMAREKQAAAVELRQMEFDLSLQLRAAALEADRVALDTRIKAFQDKVASLSV
jgi:hypothetical protein